MFLSFIYSRLFTTTISRHSQNTFYGSPECISPAKFTELTVADVCFTKARGNTGRTSAAALQCSRGVFEPNITVLLSSKAVYKELEVRLICKIEKLLSEKKTDLIILSCLVQLPYLCREAHKPHNYIISPYISVPGFVWRGLILFSSLFLNIHSSSPRFPLDVHQNIFSQFRQSREFQMNLSIDPWKLVISRRHHRAEP